MGRHLERGAAANGSDAPLAPEGHDDRFRPELQQSFGRDDGTGQGLLLPDEHGRFQPVDDQNGDPLQKLGRNPPGGRGIEQDAGGGSCFRDNCHVRRFGHFVLQDKDPRFRRQHDIRAGVGLIDPGDDDGAVVSAGVDDGHAHSRRTGDAQHLIVDDALGVQHFQQPVAERVCPTRPAIAAFAPIRAAATAWLPPLPPKR